MGLKVVADAWQVVQLDSVARFQEGPGILAKDFHREGIPLVRLAGLGHHQVTLNGCNFLDPSVVERRWNHFRLEAGDILISTSASFGRPAVVGPAAEGAVFYTGLIRFRSASPALDEGYLKTFLGSRAFMLQAEAEASGSVISHFGPSHLRRMEIPLPPLSDQIAIAEVHAALDDRIELNRRMNETLEAMTQAIFEDWFVDFGPVRRKVLGASTPAEIMGDLIANETCALELAGCFPDQLDDDGVPEGWSIGALGQFFNLIMGQSPPGDTYNDTGNGLPFFQGRTDFGFRFPVRRKYCSQPSRLAAAGDTLISVRAPVGDLNMAWEECCIGRGVAAVRHISGAKTYTFCAMKFLQPALESYDSEGTVFGAINKKQIEQLAILEPDPRLVFCFEAIAGALDDRIRVAEGESRALAEMRDYLLPRLMSGEVRSTAPAEADIS